MQYAILYVMYFVVFFFIIFAGSHLKSTEIKIKTLLCYDYFCKKIYIIT